MGWVVNATPQPLFTPGQDPVPTVRGVVTTPGARGIIPKVSWDSVLKASFWYVSCVTQL